MNRLAATTLAFLVFIGFYYADVRIATPVSLETQSDLSTPTLVEAGISSDGRLVVARQEAASSVPPRAKFPNHARTLRAFYAPDHAGKLALFVENAKPRVYYALSGSFTLTEMYPALYWSNDTTLIFYGVSSSGDFEKYAADVSQTMLTVLPAHEATEEVRENLPTLDTPL
jgi:hypothetical protein